jgi:hypothetical protein
VTPAALTIAEATWREVLKEADLVWYVRQRNGNFKADALGTPVRVHADDMADERAVESRVRKFKLFTRYDDLTRRGSMIADAEVVSLLASPRMAESRLLVEGALAEMEAKPTLDHAAALAVATRYGEPKLGQGIARLTRVNRTLVSRAGLIETLSASGMVPELDRLASMVKTDAELKALSVTLLDAARAEKPEAVAEIVRTELAKHSGTVP